MGVYGLTGPTNAYAELKAMIAAETTTLELLYDDGVNDLVVKHLGLNIFMEIIEVNDIGICIWVGDGWTSGAMVLNRYQILEVDGLYAITTGKIVVSSNFFAIGQWGGNADYITYSLIAGFSNGDVVCIGGTGEATANHWAKGYNITKLETCRPVFLNPLAGVELDGKYAKLPLYMENSNGVYHTLGVPDTVTGFGLLLKPANLTVALEGIGIDLFLNNKKLSTGENISGACIFGEGLYQ